MLFMKSALEAAGFFRPNLEKIMKAIERIQKVYDDILLQLKQVRIPASLTIAYSLRSYLEDGIRSNLHWIVGIKMAAEQKRSSFIVELISEMRHNIDRDASFLKRVLKELEKESQLNT